MMVTTSDHVIAAARSVSSMRTRPMTIAIAKYPYPYRAMMAICSDLDLTPDRVVYREIARFLNTSEPTLMGRGVGLEVGNSIFFLMPGDQFSYFGTDEAGRDMVRAMIRSGHIDCLHSYGDHARTRRDAERVLEELDKHGCQLPVWVDHSKSPTNFGPDIMVGSGDLPASAAYHADLTLRHGVRYVWRGRTTSIVGQNHPVEARDLAAIFRGRHPFGSTLTMAKQAAKIWLGSRGDARWDMHALNRVCRATILRDGQRVWELLRSNPHWAGPGQGDTADGVASVLTARMLESLVRSEGVCVLYTHLGKVRDVRRPFGEPTQAAFRRLAAMRAAGTIGVTTTHRLLRYLTVRESVRVTASRCDDGVTIAIGHVEDPVQGTFTPSLDDVMGLTFVVDRCASVTISVAGDQVASCALVHRGDTTLASVPWKPLTFPPLT